MPLSPRIKDGDDVILGINLLMDIYVNNLWFPIFLEQCKERWTDQTNEKTNRDGEPTFLSNLEDNLGMTVFSTTQLNGKKIWTLRMAYLHFIFFL